MAISSRMTRRAVAWLPPLPLLLASLLAFLAAFLALTAESRRDGEIAALTALLDTARQRRIPFEDEGVTSAEAMALRLARTIHETADAPLDPASLDWFEALDARSPLNVSAGTALARRGYGLRSHARFGPCNTMSRILILAMERAGIPARVLNLRPDAQGRGGEHTLVEFRDGDDWKVISPSDGAFVWRERNGTMAGLDSLRRTPLVFSQVYVTHPHFPYLFTNATRFTLPDARLLERAVLPLVPRDAGEPVTPRLFHDVLLLYTRLAWVMAALAGVPALLGLARRWRRGLLAACLAGLLLPAWVTAEPSTRSTLAGLEARALAGEPGAALAGLRRLADAAASPLAKAESLSSLARIHEAVAEWDQARAAHDEALALAQTSLGQGSPGLIPYWAALAVHRLRADGPDALAEASRAFETCQDLIAGTMGPEHVNTLAYLDMLAVLAMRRLAQGETALGNETLGNATLANTTLGNAALGNATKAARVADAGFWDGHPARILARVRLAEAMLAVNNHDAALAILDEAEAMALSPLGSIGNQDSGLPAILGEGHPAVLDLRLLRTEALGQAGRLDDAVGRRAGRHGGALAALRQADDAWGPALPGLAMHADAWPLVQRLAAAGRHGDALALQSARLRLWDRVVLPGQLGREADLLRLARLHLDAGDLPGAVEEARRLDVTALLSRLHLVETEAQFRKVLVDVDGWLDMSEEMTRRSGAPLAGDHPLAQLALLAHPNQPAHLDWPRFRQWRDGLAALGPEGLEWRRLGALWRGLVAAGPPGLAGLGESPTAHRRRVAHLEGLLRQAPAGVDPVRFLARATGGAIDPDGKGREAAP